MIRLLTVAARLTMMGVVAIPAVGFGEANDPKERDALARALPQAQVPLARGLSASAREGVPLSAKFEIDDGVFQLSSPRDGQRPTARRRRRCERASHAARRMAARPTFCSCCL